MRLVSWSAITAVTEITLNRVSFVARGQEHRLSDGWPNPGAITHFLNLSIFGFLICKRESVNYPPLWDAPKIKCEHRVMFKNSVWSMVSVEGC